MQRRSAGQRAGLTAAGVVAAARTVVEADGVERLTMRGVAAGLGVAPGALYTYFATKDDLVDALLDDLLAEVNPPTAWSPGRAGLKIMMTRTFDVLVAHPATIPAYLARQGARGTNARRLGDIMLTMLEDAGVTGPAREQAVRSLIVLAIGYAAIAAPTTPQGSIPTERFRADFVTALGWLLDGIIAG